MTDNNRTGLEIAVIGMAGRFPGAKNLERFWENLAAGIESICFFSEEELRQSGIKPGLFNNPGYVKARGILEDVEYFDSSFFGYTPAEAGAMDPQLRICLECSRHALENAGYNPENYDGLIGFYAGATANLMWEIRPFISGEHTLSGQFEKSHLGDKDFLSTRVAYALNLKGPAVTVFTTCSTSLVAVDMACRALLTGQCDMALAGGVTVALPTKRGYLYEEGMVMSADGHVRTFDDSANGTNGGDGIGIVVLESLEGAEENGDYIHAVIKGSEVNNDGNRRVGFQAPSVEGQEEVIRAALHIAEVDPESIGYIETHGTGTPLGDPIEIEALIRAFDTEKKQFCKIGSVKTNIGHLDSAAGIAGFIKTVLILEHKQIPPFIHFQTPNRKIDFENSPFYIDTRLTEWRGNGSPRRAGVSAFGIGGTNAHVVLEEWPGGPEREDRRDTNQNRYQLIMLSAGTQTALDRMTGNLADYFKHNPGIDLADAAYTLHAGRKTFEHRRMLVCSTCSEAVAILSAPDTGKLYSFTGKETRRPVVFMFAGQGSQYVDMGRELYETVPLFREEIDRCFDILKPLTEVDLKEILYPSQEGSDRDDKDDKEEIYRQDIVQPVVFVFEYALARLLMAWGIEPYAMIGYSIGEYVPACLAGVFSLEDALALVVARGKLMQTIPGGVMTGVPLPAKEVEPLLTGELSISIDNGPSCIVGGPPGAVEAFNRRLKEKKLLGMAVSISHAMHSKMMDPILETFEARVGRVRLNKPGLPFISNVTGGWISHRDAVDPKYWANQMRQTVRFGDGLKELLKEKNAIFLETGPGSDLCTILRQVMDKGVEQNQPVLNTIRHARQKVSDVYYLLNRLGRLWLYGTPIDQQSFPGKGKRNRIPLPVYPFDGVAYSLEVNASLSGGIIKKETPGQPGEKRPDISSWFYIPQWKISPLPSRTSPGPDGFGPFNWLLLADESPLATRLALELEQEGHNVITARAGAAFSKKSHKEYTIEIGSEDHYLTLLEELASKNNTPDRILHLLNLTDSTSCQYPESEVFAGGPGGRFFQKEPPWARAFGSLLYLAKAVGRKAHDKKIKIFVVSNGMQGVWGDDLLCPWKSLLLGPVKVIPLEYPGITCRSIDFSAAAGEQGVLIDRLRQEVRAGSSEPMVVYRGLHRLVQRFESFPLEGPEPSAPVPRLRQKGVYLITGGLGGIGLTLAEYLARTVRARLVLTGRGAGAGGNVNENDTIGPKIAKLLEFEKMGAEAAVFRADISDWQGMKEVVAAVVNRWGPINGIIHCAGIVQGGLIQQITPGQVDSGFKSKVEGTLVLDRLCREGSGFGKDLDFILLCSSLNALPGAVGEVTYCAANAFLDAFALYKTARDGVFTLAVNWDAWQGVGFAVEVEKRLSAAFKDSHEAAQVFFKHGILPAEGVEVFKRLLAGGTPRLAVSTVDLNEKLKAAAAETPTVFQGPKEAKGPGKQYPRPELGIPYVPPGNETEQMLCGIWENFLGIEQVGIHDNFFELGASSLAVVQVTGILKEKLQKEIPAPTMYAYPTVNQLAQYLGGEMKKPGMPEETAQLEALSKGKDKLKQRKKRLEK